MPASLVKCLTPSHFPCKADLAHLEYKDRCWQYTLEDEAQAFTSKRHEIEPNPPAGTEDHEYILNVFAAKFFGHTRLDQQKQIPGQDTLPLRKDNRAASGSNFDCSIQY